MSAEMLLRTEPHAHYNRGQVLDLAVRCASDVLGAVGFLPGGLVVFTKNRIALLGPAAGESWGAFETRAADLVADRVPYALAAIHPCRASEANYCVSVEVFEDGRGLVRVTVVGVPAEDLN